MPFLPLAADVPDEFVLPFAAPAPDAVAPFDCCVPLPFCVVAPAPFVPVAFPADCWDAAPELAVGEGALPVLSVWLPVLAEPVVAAWPCCGLGAELAGAGGSTLLLVGPVTPASSKAAKG